MDVDLSGQHIQGRYELETQLGAGAMGSVYRARQLVVNRQVAIKILHPDIVAEDADFRKRFEREAEALGKLEHPNLITVYDFGWWDEQQTAFMVTEFAEGQTLHDVMASHVADLDFVLTTLTEMARGLAHAHERGVLHRDVKPSNVIVDRESSKLKIVDFGLAFLRVEDDTRLTQAGEVFGTPAYMSPEQCQARTDLTPACDVYALGIIAFEMLEGRLPYDSSRAAGLLIKHVTSPVPEISADLAPPELRSLVAQMMHKEPDQRPASSELVARLTELMDPDASDYEPAEAAASTLRDKADGQAPERDADIAHLETVADLQPVERRDSKWAFILAICLVVALAGIAWIVFGQSDTQTKEPSESDAIAAADAGKVEKTASPDASKTRISAKPPVDTGVESIVEPPAPAGPSVARTKPVEKEPDDEPAIAEKIDPPTEQPVEKPTSSSEKAEAEEKPEPDSRDAGHRTIRLRY